MFVAFPQRRWGVAEPVGRKYLCRVRERQTAPNAAFIFIIVLYSGEGNRGRGYSEGRGRRRPNRGSKKARKRTVRSLAAARGSLTARKLVLGTRPPRAPPQLSFQSAHLMKTNAQRSGPSRLSSVFLCFTFSVLLRQTCCTTVCLKVPTALSRELGGSGSISFPISFYLVLSEVPR